MSVVYSASDKGHLDLRFAEKAVRFHASYGASSKHIHEEMKIAHGMVEYRKNLVLKASRVGMTLEQYCQRFNIKL